MPTVIYGIQQNFFDRYSQYELKMTMNDIIYSISKDDIQQKAFVTLERQL